MIVPDANIILYRTIEGPWTKDAKWLGEVEPRWAVPRLCRHEIANVLSRYVRQDGMSIAEADAVWQDCRFIIEGNEYDVDVPTTVRLAKEQGVTAYDAQYVVLARHLGVPLITEDGPLRRRCPNDAYTMAMYRQFIGGS